MARLSDALLLGANFILPNLMTRFELEGETEGGNGQHYAIIHKADGTYLHHNPGSPEIEPIQAMFAHDVLRLLNKELHHDGMWCLVFTHPKPPALAVSAISEYARFGFIWCDRDGDPQFTSDWVEGQSDDLFDMGDVLNAGPALWGDIQEGAYTMYRTLMIDVLDPKQSQLQRAGLGQRAPSLVH